MKIWITEIGEPLPLEPQVRLHRYGQFTRYLAGRGHDVTWWTSSFSHAPKKHFADKDSEVIHEGVRLKFIRGPGYSRNVSFARIRHQGHFALRFAALARETTPPDLLISPIPTIEVASEAVRYAREAKIPMLTDIRDLWPDEIRDLAPKPLRPLAEILLAGSYHKLRSVCKHATGIMGVSQSYLEYGLKAAGREQSANDCFFPLGYSSDPIAPEILDQGRAWRAGLGLSPTSFKICFFGTIGKYFDLTTVIAAARELGPEYEFLLGGDGSSLAAFKQLASGLKNVHFLGWLKAPQIQAVMEVSQAGLAPYALEAKMELPNKPFEYMSGSLPLISSLKGQMADILRNENCGISYRADSVSELVRAIKGLAQNPAATKQMGERARLVLEKDFSTEKVFARVEEHLKTFARPRGT